MARKSLQKNRKYEVVDEFPLIAIFANGEQTEVNYFRALCKELNLVSVRFIPDRIHIEGNEYNTVSLIKYTCMHKDKYDEVWVVFDKDDHFEQFNEAISLANKNGINVAYSNECFELWFILHFEYLNTDIGRANYNKRLSVLLGEKYEKNSSKMYGLIKDNEAEAIRNAKNLEVMHAENAVISPQKMVPSTTVYLLVERLRALKVERKNNL